MTIYCQHWESNIFLWTKNGSYWTSNIIFLFWDLNMYIFAGILKIVCIVYIVSIVDVIFLWYTQMAIRFLSKPKYCKNDFIFGVQGVPKRGDRDAVWKYRPLNPFEIMKASKFSTDWFFSCRKKLFQLLTSNGFTHLRSIARCHKNDLDFSTKAFYNLRPIYRTTLIR